MTKEVVMATKRFVTLAILGLLISVTSWAVDSDAVARATARVSKGDAALTEGSYPEAEKHYRKAAEIAPNFPTAYLGLGAALVGQKRYVEALAALGEAESRFIEYEIPCNLHGHLWSVSEGPLKPDSHPATGRRDEPL
jgi:Flp pilus assembly protein TadD